MHTLHLDRELMFGWKNLFKRMIWYSLLPFNPCCSDSLILIVQITLSMADRPVQECKTAKQIPAASNPKKLLVTGSSKIVYSSPGVLDCTAIQMASKRFRSISAFSAAGSPTPLHSPFVKPSTVICSLESNGRQPIRDLMCSSPSVPPQNKCTTCS